MPANPLYRLLETPWIYRLSQAVLAPGAEQNVTRLVQDLLGQLPAATRCLDIGCGPSSVLWKAGLAPVGLDVLLAYSRQFAAGGQPAVTASAVELPFPRASFDGVWSVGLLHHLPPGAAAGAVAEMLRVCRPGGYVVIVDAVLPEPAWHRPLAYALRRLDRGRFVRSQAGMEALLPQRASWQVRRYPYAVNGLEVVACAWRS